MFPANLIEATFKQVSRAGLRRGGAGGEERPGYPGLVGIDRLAAFLTYTGRCSGGAGGAGIGKGSIS